MTTESTNRPKQQLRDGTTVVSIFENATDKGTRYSVTVTRIYKRDGASEWERSASLNADDCLRAAELLRDAHHWIRDQRQGE